MITTRATFTRASVRVKASALIWTVASTRGNMRTTNRKEMEPTAGKTAKVMKVSGKTEFSKEKGSSIFQTELFSTVCGRTDCRQGSEFASTPTEAATMETGKRVNHMASARKRYPMEPPLTDSGSKGKLEATESKS